MTDFGSLGESVTLAKVPISFNTEALPARYKSLTAPRRFNSATLLAFTKLCRALVIVTTIADRVLRTVFKFTTLVALTTAITNL